MIKTLIVSRYHDAAQTVIPLFKGSQQIAICGQAESEESALSAVDTLDPAVVIILFAGGDSDLLSVAKRLYVSKPKIAVVAFTAAEDENEMLSLYAQAVQAGVKYIGKVPASRQDLESRILSILNTEKTRQSYLADSRNRVVYSSEIVGFYSAKDGVGKTSLAINTAVALAQVGKTVALLDYDIEFGDIAAYLGIEPKKTVADVCQDFEKPTISQISSYMVLHSSGVQILAAPKAPEYAEIVTAEKASQILTVLKSYFDYVIVDLPSGMRDWHMNVFKAINKIMVVTDTALPTLKNTKAALSDITALQSISKVAIVVNRTSKFDCISMKDIHKVLTAPIVCRIPSDYKVMNDAVLRNTPVVIGTPKSSISTEIINLAKVIVSKNKDFDIWDIKPNDIDQAYDDLDNIAAFAAVGKHSHAADRHFSFGRKRR